MYEREFRIKFISNQTERQHFYLVRVLFIYNKITRYQDGYFIPDDLGLKITLHQQSGLLNAYFLFIILYLNISGKDVNN